MSKTLETYKSNHELQAQKVALALEKHFADEVKNGAIETVLNDAVASGKIHSARTMPVAAPKKSL